MYSGSDPKSLISGSYRRRRVVIDVGVVVAAALLDVGVASNSTGRDLDPLGFVIWGVTLGSLMWRRRNSLVVLGITASAAITFALVGYRASNVFPFLIAIYSVVVYGRTKVAARIAVVVAGIAVVTVSVVGEGFRLEDLATNALLLGGAFVIGETIRARNALAQVEVEGARREAEDERRRADEVVAAQRLEIARELHDIVAHSVTVMTVQLGGARLAIADEPDRAREALREAERAGRMAMRELRRMLTVLRGADEDATSNVRSGDARMELLIEEYGFRGYMLPKLQSRYSALVAGIITGAAWTVWHYPPLPDWNRVSARHAVLAVWHLGGGFDPSHDLSLQCQPRLSWADDVVPSDRKRFICVSSAPTREPRRRPDYIQCLRRPRRRRSGRRCPDQRTELAFNNATHHTTSIPRQGVPIKQTFPPIHDEDHSPRSRQNVQSSACQR